ncbi:hypothetical protein GBA52_018103 [Prunus armeniaca]|nr:hypothetical protein GBA52_018103 [Prunus armeniaca]
MESEICCERVMHHCRCSSRRATVSGGGSRSSIKYLGQFGDVLVCTPEGYEPPPGIKGEAHAERPLVPAYEIVLDKVQWINARGAANHQSRLRTLTGPIQSVWSDGAVCTKGQGRCQRVLMTRAY